MYSNLSLKLIKLGNMYSLIALILTFGVISILLITRLILLVSIFVIKRKTKLDVRVTNYRRILQGYISFSVTKSSNLYVEVRNCSISSRIFNRRHRKLVVLCLEEIIVDVVVEDEKKSKNKLTAKKKQNTSLLRKLIRYIKLLGLDVGWIQITLRRDDKLTELSTNSVSCDLKLTNQSQELQSCLDVTSLRIVCKSLLLDNKNDQRADENVAELKISFLLKIYVELSDTVKLKKFLWNVTSLKACISSGLDSSKQISSSSNKLALLPEVIEVAFSEIDITGRKFVMDSDISLQCKKIGFTSSVSISDITNISTLHCESKAILTELCLGVSSKNLVSMSSMHFNYLMTENGLNAELSLNNIHANLTHSELLQWSQCLSALRKSPVDSAVSSELQPIISSSSETKSLSNSGQNESKMNRKSQSIFAALLTRKSVNLRIDVNHVGICLLGEEPTGWDRPNGEDRSKGGDRPKGGVELGLVNIKLSANVPSVENISSVISNDAQLDIELISFYIRHINSLEFPTGKIQKDFSSVEFPSDKQHVWGVLFYTGLLVLRASRFLSHATCDIIVDSIQSEISPALFNTAETMLDIVGPLSKIFSKSKYRPVEGLNSISAETGIALEENLNENDVELTTDSNKSIVRKVGVIALQCVNINIYALCENKVLTCLRSDSLILQRKEDLVNVNINDTKLVHTMQNKSKSRPVVRCAEIQNPQTYLKSVRLEYNASESVVHVKALEQAIVGWSISLHMCVYELWKQGGTVRDRFKDIMTDIKQNKVTKEKKNVKKGVSLSLKCEPGVTINITTSRNHLITFDATDLTVEKSADSSRLFQCTSLNIVCDQQQIFEIEEAKIYSEFGSERFKLERINQNPPLEPINRAWVVDLYSFHVIFPFDFNFAECLDDFKLINKWRKVIFKKGKKPFTVDSPLWADILIKVKTASMELPDDPFEVRLGDIYALRCDENIENDKRLAAMDKRLQDLRKKSSASIPVEKIESLYEALSHKSTEVYIQRASQLYSSTPMRTSLFTWSLEGVEILALADRSYNGKENVMKHMGDIDSQSPLPDDIEFSSLFCRMVNASFASWTFQMRDFPLPMLNIVDFHIWGRLIGSEQIGTPRAKRKTEIDMGGPWGKITVERNMPSMKYYHDFSADIQSFDMAYGPCWEPTMAQMNLAMNNINRPSADPSQSLPFWDKCRLMFHGRLTASIERSTWLYHASLDPYNTTEFMDWTWDQLVVDWTDGKWVLLGTLDIYSKTASKYDDCRLIHLPGLRLCILFEYLCAGNPHDHHSVMPCAPDKVPLNLDKEYDTYELFRSSGGFNSSLLFEIAELSSEKMEDALPSCVIYASTLKWMDRVKTVMNRISRPVRRGKLFKNVRPRKQQFMKSIKNLKFLFDVPKFRLQYWVSFSTHQGMELLSDQLKLDVDMVSTITKSTETPNLIRKPVLVWSIKRFDSLLSSVNVWLCSGREVRRQESYPLSKTVDKAFLLSVEKVVYQRQEESCPSLDAEIHTPEDELSDDNFDTPTHKLTVRDLKGSWTPANRNIAIGLYDGYVKSSMVRSSLSANALKGFKVEVDSKAARRTSAPTESAASPNSLLSPRQRIQSGPVQNLLEKLVEESSSRFFVSHEELSGGAIQTEELRGVTACKTFDVLRKNWLIELHNSQVMLRGVETTGYIIVSASHASLVCHDHAPKWNYQQQLTCKTSLVGNVEGMQYYATIDAGTSRSNESIHWLTKDNIRDQGGCPSPKSSTLKAGEGLDMNLVGLADMLGCGQSVGGVVNDGLVVNHAGPASNQLQRIISRCRCQIFCAWYGEVKSDTLAQLPAPATRDNSDVMSRKEEEDADVFTFLHHDLKICTNSVQYAMILDIVNNLLLYVEPKKKELTERLQNMRFRLQLGTDKDQRAPIQQRQKSLRELVAKVRRLERELYVMQRAGSDDEVFSEDQQSKDITKLLDETKEQVASLSQELSIMISCYRERQLQQSSQTVSGKARGQKEAPLVRTNEVYFRQAEWRMTDIDGQIGIADLFLENFLYTKLNRENDSGSHHLELGFFKVTNLLPNSVYTDVLVPETREGFGDRLMALRVICRFSSPVGGISVREHFEVNVLPLTIQMTARFYTQVMAFFFPNKKEESDDDDEIDKRDFDDLESLSSGVSSASTGSGPSRLTHSSTIGITHCSSAGNLMLGNSAGSFGNSGENFPVGNLTVGNSGVGNRGDSKRSSMRNRKSIASNMSGTSGGVNDIDKMKERAAKNNMFAYIKIPEVPLRVSYKSDKEKHILNIHDFHFLLRTLEYHDQTWTWHDLAMAIKSDCKKVIIGQALQQKLRIKSRSFLPIFQTHEGTDKAMLLMGPKLMGSKEKDKEKDKTLGKKRHNH